MTVQEYVKERIQVCEMDFCNNYSVQRNTDGTKYIIDWVNGYECFNDFYQDCIDDMVDNVYAYEEYEVETTNEEIEKELETHKEYLERLYNDIMTRRKPYETSL